VTLADEIQDLANRVHDGLRAGHDYYRHAKLSWRLVRGHAKRGGGFKVRNPETGTVVNAMQLANLSWHYEASYLAESVFQHFVSLFEDFLFELLRLWLSAYPAGIPNKDKKPVDLATIIDAVDKAAILGLVIDRELNDLRYTRPAAWFKYLNDRVKLGCPTDEQIEGLTEVKASRDILIHNRGIVNATYLEKAGTRARYKLGQRLEIQEPYLRETWQLIRDVVGELATAAIAKA
jgi:hypothetical protein